MDQKYALSVFGCLGKFCHAGDSPYAAHGRRTSAYGWSSSIRREMLLPERSHRRCGLWRTFVNLAQMLNNAEYIFAIEEEFATLSLRLGPRDGWEHYLSKPGEQDPSGAPEG